MDDDKLAGVILLLGIIATVAVIFVIVHFLAKVW